MTDTASVATETEVLRLDNITVARGGRPVVREVTIDIPAGEVTALLGPNGAGKSSLVLAVGGVLRARRPARSCWASRTWPRTGRSGSARPAWRSSPRGGACCPSSPCRTT